MNKFKMLVAATLAVGTVLAAAPAMTQGAPQGNRGAQGRHFDPVPRLTQELGLSQEQQTQLRTIFTNFHNEMQSMRNNPNAQSHRQDMFKSLEESIDKVLTPAQQKKFKEMGGLRGGFGRNGMTRVLDTLGLTPAQKTEIEAIMKDQRSQMEAVRGDSKLSEADKRSRMEEIRKSHRTSIENVLTPAQRTKLQQIMQQHGGRGGGGGVAR